MSAIAQVLRERGAKVSGSDQKESEVTRRLADIGVRINIGHDANNVNGATLVAYSAAVSPDNPEREAAERLGIPTLERSVMLGRMMDGFKKRVAISGTHGKTTTTSMAALILIEAGLDPTVLIGGDLDAIGGNARTGQSDVFVTEACEAFSSFLELRPNIAVVTNIDADHMEHHKTMDGVISAFRQFLSQTDPDGVLILCKDDENIRKLLPELNHRVVTYGVQQSADLVAANLELKEQAAYDLVRNGTNLGRVELGLPGVHYVANSLAAAAVGFELGASFDDVRDVLRRYRGTDRRFDMLGNARGVTVIDDYAHHPNEVKATLEAARTAYTGRVIAVFQPHLYTRTRYFFREFAEALSIADYAIVTEIYPSREAPIEGVSGKLIVQEMGGRAEFAADKKDVPARVEKLAVDGDVVIFMGAGDIREEAEATLERLSR